MSLQLLIGSPGSGKTKHILKIFKKFSPSEHCLSIRVIVPTLQQVFDFHKLLLADPDFNGVLGDPICVFRKFAQDALIDSGLACPTIISETQRHSLLKQAAESIGYFRRTKDFSGFPETLGKAIQTLKSSNITPEDLRLAAEKASSEKLLALAEAYFSYQETLSEKGLFDYEEILLRALDVMKDKNSILEAYKCVILDGFENFTPLQQEFIKHFCAHIPKVIVTLDYDENRPKAFAAIEPVYHFLASISDCEIKKFSLPNGKGALAHQKANIFEDDPSKIEPDESLKFMSCSTTTMQFESAACEIRKLLRDGGCLPNEIAVIARDMRYLANDAREIFARYDIPFSPVRLPLSNNPFTRSILSKLKNKPYNQKISDWIESMARHFHWPNDDFELKETHAVLKAIRRISDEISTVEYPDAISLFESALLNRTYVFGNADGVNILDSHALCRKKFQVVFAVNLVDGQFPRRQRQEPFFLEREREAVNSVCPNAFSFNETFDYERYLFFTTISAAQEKLYLCWSADGEPSPYLSAVSEVFMPEIKRITKGFSSPPSIELSESLESLTASTILTCSEAKSDGEQRLAAAAYNILLEKGHLSAADFAWIGQENVSEKRTPPDILDVLENSAKYEAIDDE